MEYSAFSYKQGFSFLHRCPAWIKILLIPVVSIPVFYLPPAFALGLLTLQTLVSFILRFTIREQLTDLKAIIYYAVFLVFAKLTGNFAAIDSFEFKELHNYLIIFLKDEKETWLLLMKLFCVMQSASVVLKTSTSLQIREGLEKIEITVRNALHLKAKKTEACYAPLAQTISVFICFIPQVSKNWQQAARAWKARGGKKSIRMLLVLLPVFFSVGMKQAYNSARALSVRNCQVTNSPDFRLTSPE